MNLLLHHKGRKKRLHAVNTGSQPLLIPEMRNSFVTPSSCFLFFFQILMYYLFLAALGLCCCAWAFFSSCGDWWLLSVCGAWASHYSGFSCCRMWALVLRLSSCGAQAQLPLTSGILTDQGSNLGALHWHEDSQSLGHKGGPFLLCFQHLPLNCFPCL